MKVLQIHPTLKCSNNCDWCPYVSKEIELPLEKITNALLFAFWNGCNILKISGGGEPLEYSSISLVFSYAQKLNFKIYLQTNGYRLNNITREAVDDIRVSYGDGKKFKPPRVLPDGFSYVVSENPDYDNLKELLEFAIHSNCYVRITQDDRNIEKVPLVKEIQTNINTFSAYIIPPGAESDRLEGGKQLIRFWDAKNYHRGKNPCPSCESLLLGADGWWYPCCKTHCAKELVQGYNETMRLGRTFPSVTYDGSKCQWCYY